MPTKVSAPTRAVPGEPIIKLPPMSNANPIHKKMMSTILHHRQGQLKRLARKVDYFECFVKLLVRSIDVDQTKKTNKGRRALLQGEYACHLLRATNGGISLDKVALHYIALMYSSLDDRLSENGRMFALSCIKAASKLLNEWLGKMERKDELDEIVDEMMGDLVENDEMSVGDGSLSTASEELPKKRNKRGRKRRSTSRMSIDSDRSIGNYVRKNSSGLSDQSLEGEEVSRKRLKKNAPLEPEKTNDKPRNRTEGGVNDDGKGKENVDVATTSKDKPSVTYTQEKHTASVDSLSKQMMADITGAEFVSNKTATPTENMEKMAAAKKCKDAKSRNQSISKKTQSISHSVETVEGQSAATVPPVNQTGEKSTDVAEETVHKTSAVSEKGTDVARDPAPKSVASTFQQKVRGTSVSEVEMADGPHMPPNRNKSRAGLSPIPAPVAMRTGESETDAVKEAAPKTSTASSPQRSRGTSVSDVEMADSTHMSPNELAKNVTEQSTEVDNDALSPGKSTPSATEGTKKSISSGATSAFEPISPGRRSASASIGAASTISPANKEVTKPASSAATTNEDVTSEQGQSKPANNNTFKPVEPAPSNKAQGTNADDHDVIDLTTPPGSPAPPSPLKANPHKGNNTPKPTPTKLATPAIKQLPASPPPVTEVLIPSATPSPAPRPFTKTRQVTFLPDLQPPYRSATVYARPSNSFSYDSGFHLDGSGACLEHETHLNVQERLSTWDPYWRVVGDVGTKNEHSSGAGMTLVGTRTVACAPMNQSTAVNSSSVNSCAVLLLNLPNINGICPNWFNGVKWGEMATPDTTGKDKYKTGDRRLILRTMPLFRTAKDAKKRADTHIWPKGSLVQLGLLTSAGHPSNETIVPINQRRQEKHDEKSWKGMSHVLDLTRYASPQSCTNIKLCSCEVVENVSVQNTLSCANGSVLSGSYALHAAICEYLSPDDLYDMLMGKKAGGDVLIPTLSERSAKIIAMEYVSNQTVALEDSDDEDGGAKLTDESESNSLTFSLLCPIQKTPMETPVRGRNCKHMQCFDLKNFLRINEHVSGGRWRCGNCENFISVRDLIHCGLFQAMIDKYKGQISGIRDKVSLESDGSFYLKDENKLRYASKKPAAAAAATEEIIDLD